MQHNLKVAESTPYTWKAMKKSDDIGDLLDHHPHFGLVVLDQSGFPVFLHTLSYDRESQVFAGISGASFTEKPIMFKLTEDFFYTCGESIKLMSQGVLSNWHSLRHVYNLKQLSSTVAAADDPGFDPTKWHSPDDGDDISENIAQEGKHHDLQDTIFPPFREFLSAQFPFHALDLGLDADLNVFHHPTMSEPPEIPREPGDQTAFMPGFCLVPPLLIVDFLKMTARYSRTDRLSGIGSTEIIPWLLARCEDVDSYSGTTNPARLHNYRILIHWLIVWLDFATHLNFPQIEVIEFDQDETLVYILNRVPAENQDDVAALLFQTSDVGTTSAKEPDFSESVDLPSRESDPPSTQGVSIQGTSPLDSSRTNLDAGLFAATLTDTQSVSPSAVLPSSATRASTSSTPLRRSSRTASRTASAPTSPGRNRPDTPTATLGVTFQAPTELPAVTPTPNPCGNLRVPVNLMQASASALASAQATPSRTPVQQSKRLRPQTPLQAQEPVEPDDDDIDYYKDGTPKPARNKRSRQPDPVVPGNPGTPGNPVAAGTPFTPSTTTGPLSVYPNATHFQQELQAALASLARSQAALMEFQIAQQQQAHPASTITQIVDDKTSRTSMFVSLGDRACLALLRGSTCDDRMEPLQYAESCNKIFSFTNRQNALKQFQNDIVSLKSHCLLAPAHAKLLLRHGPSWRIFNVPEGFSIFSLFPKGELALALQASAEKMEDRVLHGQKIDDESYLLIQKKFLHAPSQYYDALSQIESYADLCVILFGSRSIIARVTKSMAKHLHENREIYTGQTTMKSLYKMMLYAIDIEVQYLLKSCADASIPFDELPFDAFIFNVQNIRPLIERGTFQINLPPIFFKSNVDPERVVHSDQDPVKVPAKPAAAKTGTSTSTTPAKPKSNAGAASQPSSNSKIRVNTNVNPAWKPADTSKFFQKLQDIRTAGGSINSPEINGTYFCLQYLCKGSCRNPTCSFSHQDPRDVGKEQAMSAFCSKHFNNEGNIIA